MARERAARASAAPRQRSAGERLREGEQLGGGEQQHAGVGERLRRFADWLEHARRAPLYVALMRGAAADFDAGGVVARAFDGIPVPPGSVPALRLMAALHYLVLVGRAPPLEPFFASVGGREAPGRAWPAAAQTLGAHLEEVRARLRRGVQTNEPGRSAAIYGGLLWISERVGAPLRVLEIGASAGLNLLPDRFAYLAGGRLLGAASSPLRFDEPWRGEPVRDPAAAGERLQLIARAGCDLAPIDVRAPGTRELLLSYVWPDDTERLARLEAALALARDDPPLVERARASEWLQRALAEPGEAIPVVVQSVVWQYLGDDERAGATAVIEHAGARRALAWLTFEAAGDALERFELAVRVWPGGERVALASCGDHGPPVEWLLSDS